MEDLNEKDETSLDSSESLDSTKLKLSDELKDKLKAMPEVLKFIQKLQKYIDKQKRKLKKLKQKMKKIKQIKSVGTQTETNEGNTKKEPKSLADEIKEAAEMATQNSGFVYEETSGMYYDYNTGYYYNAEYGLYYDGNTGIYYNYNQETKSYEFHSQVDIKSEHEKTKSKRKPGNISKVNSYGLENVISSIKSLTIANQQTIALDISKQWPPCMRIIVQSSECQKIKTGSLHIITFEGGTIGREGDHAIVIPDISTSKHHLKIYFDKEAGKYFGIDLGSRNGTLLNNKRMSPSKQESEPLEIVHGSKIQIGSCVFLCHIHEGNQTCGHCEPGLTHTYSEEPVIYKTEKKVTKSELHKRQLKELRKKFGISNYDENGTKLGSGYKDRAQERRNTVGSQNPHEKTESASLEESIKADNKGFKLLSKMGWKEGESLGKDNGGIVEPIKLLSNKGCSGLGSTQLEVATNEVPLVPENKQNIWKKTQERFQKLPSTNAVFDADSD